MMIAGIALASSFGAAQISGVPTPTTTNASAPLIEPPPRAAVSSNLPTRRLEAETRYAESYYAHLARMNEITEGKFTWQDRASNVTLWLVVFVVVSGIGLSFFQIWIAFHRGPGPGTSDTTIEASATSFRVTSSVVGIVILIISTGFLYLFLKEVYDIKLLDITKTTAQPVQGSAAGSLSPQDFGLPPSIGEPPASANRASKSSNTIGN